MSEPGEPAVFMDENPDTPPDARYKGLLPANYRPKDFRRGLLAFKSPDGLHWSPMSDRSILADGAFDSQNLAFWDAQHGHYRAYWRYFTKGGIRPERGLESAGPSCDSHSYVERLFELARPARPLLFRFTFRATLHKPGQALPSRTTFADRLSDTLCRARPQRRSGP